MTYQVLARKWRPRAFEALVGQAHVVTALANALDSGRLHHAYLFTGTRGVGKTTLARILAKALNCETGITSKPCGTCRACTEIDAGRFIDLLEVDAATNTKVDEMRELLETAQYMPTSGRFKVYLIDEVHMLSKPAFNSMLKTLEEPPEHVKFILATTDPQRVPVTVLSRCLQFNLTPLAPAAIAAHLKRVLETEGAAFEEPALALIAKAAAGSVRDSLSLLDQAIAHGGGRVATSQVAEMLGTVGADLVWPLLECIAAGDGRGAVEEAGKIGARSVAFDSALEDLASLLYRVALAQAGIEPAPDEADRERVRAMAAKLDRARVQVIYQVALLGRRDLPLAPDELAGFTMTVLRMLSFAAPGAAAKVVTGATAQAPAAPSIAPAAAPAMPAEAPAAPAPVMAAPPVAGEGPKFDGNWAEFVSRLELNGMAGLLARYGELASFRNNHLELVVPESQKAYAERSYQEKLRAVLEPLFGTGFRLTVRTGVPSGSSLAAARAKENEQRQASAVTAIEQDPFVRDLVREFGAEVVPASIRPPGRGSGGESD